MRAAVRPSMSQNLFVVKAREPGDAEREEQRARLLSVRVVGGVEELLRRDAVEHVEQVDRAPDGRVEEDAGAPAEGLRERREVGDPPWAMISWASG